MDDVAWEVVGVVDDEGLSWNGAPEAMMYGSREQSPSEYLALVVRGAIDPDRLQESIRQAVSAVDRDQALANVLTLDELKMIPWCPTGSGRRCSACLLRSRLRWLESVWTACCRMRSFSGHPKSAFGRRWAQARAAWW